MKDLHERRFPGESNEYRTVRNELLEAERALRTQVEEVAALRRRLPLGGVVEEDYTFEEATADGVREVRLSELFAPGKDSLLLYHFMFGPEWEKPCTSCTSIVDTYNGTAPHVQDRVNFVVVAKAGVEKLRELAASRGWDKIRIVSSHKNDFKERFNAQIGDPPGNQYPLLSVFVRREGAIHHFWSSELLFVPVEGMEPRHVDMTWPLWNLLDLTPEGRGTDWHPKLSYRPDGE